MTSARLLAARRLALASWLLALAATTAQATPTPAEVMDWAERSYPQFFPPRQLDVQAPPYVYRYYPQTRNYLGVADGTVYVMGPVSGGALQPVGTLAQFECQVQPTRCEGPALPRFAFGHGLAAVQGADGSFTVWGNNLDGGGSTGQATVPGTGLRTLGGPARQVVLTTTVGAIVDQEGRVSAWARYGYTVGRPTGAKVSYEQRLTVPFPGSVRQLDAAIDLLYGLQTDGSVWAFRGHRFDAKPYPAQVPPGLVLISNAHYRTFQLRFHHFAYAADSDGVVWRIDLDDGAPPVQVAGTRDVRWIDCSLGHNGDGCVALRRDGTVLAWAMPPVLTPTPAPLALEQAITVPGLKGIRQVYGGLASATALAQDGSLWTWRSDFPLIEAAEQAGRNRGMTDLYCSGACLARRKDGSVWGWGSTNLMGSRCFIASASQPCLLPDIVLP